MIKMKKIIKYWMESRKGAIFMVKDIILNKAQIIERCWERINEEYDNNEENLKNYTTLIDNIFVVR